MRVQRTTRRLAETVVAFLSQPTPGATCETLQSFTMRDWEQSYYWLDASGVALYFLEAVKQQRLENSVPVEVLRRLEQNQAGNRRRTADLFDEFIKINETFRRSSVRYVTLKGFASTPDYCRDLSLRNQMDLDFLISPADEGTCRELLEQMGYRLKGIGDLVAEFKAGEEQPPALDRLYEPRTERAVELHLAAPPVVINDTDELIRRSSVRFWNGFSFPVLSPGDMFLSQSFHLLRHVRSEWTRLSWLLEFTHFVRGRSDDAAFWTDIRRLAEDIDGTEGIGVVTLLATEVFGEFAPRELTSWSVDTLSVPVRLWAGRYAWQTILAEFPGTKLYLLLEKALAAGSGSRNGIRRGKLLPTHLPRQIFGSAGSSVSRRMRGRVTQLRFILFRLRFHIAAGVQYLVEAHRWKRAMSVAEQLRTTAKNDDDCAVRRPASISS
jgi:hypothetical protein